METLLRAATLADIPGIVAIYNHEVVHGTSNYESREHTVEERAQWLTQLNDKNYPVLVVQSAGEIIGFGSLSPFNPITGYRLTVTGALYVKAGSRGAGVGRKIAEGLIEAAQRRGLHSIVVAVSALNVASLTLLESVGFRRVGIFREIGQKHGQWFDDVGLQIQL